MNKKNKDRLSPVISRSGVAFTFQSIVGLKIHQDNSFIFFTFLTFSIASRKRKYFLYYIYTRKVEIETQNPEFKKSDQGHLMHHNIY